MTVYLVGAGPGDPGLMTVRGAELMSRAEAVVHDRLVGSGLLALAPAGAELVDVGKRPGGAAAQQEINDLLVALGRRLSVVVRLKGGDPFVFGRGGEEALALVTAGLDFEVVPGISAALGVPAYAGVPLTHRRLAPCFTVVTGHVASPAEARPGRDQPAGTGPAPAPDWDALARLGGTIVILMGAENRSEIAARLVNGGRPAATPVLVVESGTLPGQRTQRTTLGALGDEKVGAPATIVVGDVAALGEEGGRATALRWFERRPLFGWTVVVTRPRQQAPELVTALEAAGARTVQLPSIAIAEPADGGAALRRAVGRLGEYDWVVFTSANAVERLMDLLRDARDFGTAKVAAIGTGTAAVLAGRGIVADIVPERFVAESLLEAIPVAPSAGGRVLLPRAAVARDVLPRGLSAKGWSVDVVETYRTERPKLDDDLLEAARAADAVAFTASSTVTGFLELVGGPAPLRPSEKPQLPRVVACIGPITAATARRSGLAVDIVAGVHSIAGLVDALAAWARANGRSLGSDG